MTQAEIDEEKLKVEQEQLKVAEESFLLERKKVEETLQLEHQKYELECQKHELEKRKSRWPTNPIVVATVVAVAGFLANAFLENWKASNEFKLKAAEIVMNSSGVDATKERADALQKLFPDQLRENFGNALRLNKTTQPENPDLAGDPAPKEALIRLLAEHPTQREQIIKDYSAVFTDKWIECLQTPNPCH